MAQVRAHAHLTRMKGKGDRVREKHVQSAAGRFSRWLRCDALAESARTWTARSAADGPTVGEVSRRCRQLRRRNGAHCEQVLVVLRSRSQHALAFTCNAVVKRRVRVVVAQVSCSTRHPSSVPYSVARAALLVRVSVETRNGGRMQRHLLCEPNMPLTYLCLFAIGWHASGRPGGRTGVRSPLGGGPGGC